MVRVDNLNNMLIQMRETSFIYSKTLLVETWRDREIYSVLPGSVVSESPLKPSPY